ncbi:D-2-hydroxyacid dehydrogenase [Methylonatrum kenyense]|uniref:D-2-hydroxyacid dehydrogenase n=1 Tax=Methylonatrum kenyense TaxID=455253 RepID=UPI0020C08DBD|nr:D-2-hydroxyacid dehydrogenase [Methylonatrum kenyense]MCK8517128.1 D-2-hydroxyacid dehydrogenase [Methylonatrum kenyense]
MTDRPRIAIVTAAGESWPPGLDPLRGQAELMLANDERSLREALPEADILMVTDFRTDLLEDCWPEQHRIRWIHATSAGVDALMIPPIRHSDIPVTNARGIFDRPIAEFVLGLILCFAKDYPGSLRYQAERAWVHRETERIEGKRALIVGAGSIGRQIGKLLSAVGLAVTAMSRSAREGDPDFDRVHAAERFQSLLPDADYVVIAAPLTPDTEGLFDADAFSRMQPTARLINIGRGPIVRTDDLVAALDSGEIAGAGLDVFEQEPLPANHPLWDMPNVILSAHMAGDVIGWKEALSEQFIANFERWQAGEPLHNPVDKERGYAAR